MQIFKVTVERTTRHSLRVLADSMSTAQAMAQQTLSKGAHIITAEPVEDDRLFGKLSPERGLEALDHILTRPFLPREDGQPSYVGGWVRMAAAPETQEIANRALAVAGLRVKTLNDCPMLFIASAVSNPTLRLWFEGFSFGVSGAQHALASLPGAFRPGYSFTMAGIRSRVIGIPLTTVFDEAAQ